MEEQIMTDAKTYYKFFVILAVVAILIYLLPTILPIMDDDEYFVDKNGIIHGDNCPYKSVPWFTQKYSKYNILIKQDQEICKECLLPEEDKLWDLHYINLELKNLSLRRNGAPEDYIKQKLKLYKHPH